MINIPAVVVSAAVVVSTEIAKIVGHKTMTRLLSGKDKLSLDIWVEYR